MAFAIENDEEYDFELAGDAFVASPDAIAPPSASSWHSQSPEDDRSATTASHSARAGGMAPLAPSPDVLAPIAGASSFGRRIMTVGALRHSAAHGPPALPSTGGGAPRDDTVTSPAGGGPGSFGPESPPPAEVEDAAPAAASPHEPAGRQHLAPTAAQGGAPPLPRNRDEEVAHEHAVLAPVESLRGDGEQRVQGATAWSYAWGSAGGPAQPRAPNLDDLGRRLRDARARGPLAATAVPPALAAHPAVRSALRRYEQTLGAAEAAHARLEAVLYARLEAAARLAASAAAATQASGDGAGVERGRGWRPPPAG